MVKKRVLILGATGSIGTQTVDVCQKLASEFEICGLTAHSSLGKLNEIAASYPEAKTAVGEFDAEKLIDECNPDIVVNALVGAAGVRASYYTLQKGIRLALANKESLVVAGDILMPIAKNVGDLMPIDSEHGAIYQCLVGERHSEVSKLWVTASGGPFRGSQKADLAGVTASQALAHPTWKMGPKITIDSATLMNKGLEVIEAHHLFNMDFENIKVVVQPQSVVHSMVEFIDGSVKAHLGTTDMRIPIQYALTFPDRAAAPVEPIDFCTLGSIEFAKPDMETFECLKLAYEIGEAGGVLPCAMNAANEIANQAFRDGKCGFLDIAETIKVAVSKISPAKAESIEQLEAVDAQARKIATEHLGL